MNQHPWRPRAPQIQGNICPICSNSHFPFCPPPSLSFTEAPRFQVNNKFSYANPYDPFIEHRGAGAMNLHRPFVQNQRPGWVGNPNYDHSGVGLKRMRVNEDQNERRLRLIRDHGSMPSDPAYPYAMQPNHDYSRLSQFGNLGQPIGATSRPFVNAQPPLPNSPPPPLPLEPQSLRYSLLKTPSLFPVQVAVTSSAEPHNFYNDNTFSHTSTGFSPEVSSKSFMIGNQTFPVRPLPSDTPKPVDACHIFKQPYRATRPDRIVVILRGLPGSGKSYLAKMIRDVEVENGGDAPRIHSMDDYFMTEVEKAEENDSSVGSARGKKRVIKKVMEYCYEPEMEEAYRSSMLKAFKKTLDDRVFSFIIVDDRNLRIAHFAQFWATAKRSGYEVYLLEAAYKDPAGCAARNVHSFSQDDIERMAGQWEEAPSLYMKLDMKTLLHGDRSEESDIQEVDMDTEDAEPAGNSSEPDSITVENASVSHKEEFKHYELFSKDEEKAAHVSGEEEVKELRKSKWSDDVDDDDDYDDSLKGKIGNSSALSGLLQAYSKKSGKSVRWGDEGKNTGFLISAAKREKSFSLVIGPGAGYNLKSNPLAEEEKKTGGNSNGEWKKQSVFQEQLRAEKESFKAVFDKRRHRISGLENLEDS